jgi:hypothetical protein
MDQVTALALIEVAKTLINGAFSLMKTAGKTDEEIDLIYQGEKEKFVQNKPENLPDV